MSEIIIENDNKKKPNQKIIGLVILIMLVLVVCIAVGIKSFVDDKTHATTIVTATTKAIIIPAMAPPLRPELFDLIKYLRLLLFDLSVL